MGVGVGAGISGCGIERCELGVGCRLGFEEGLYHVGLVAELVVVVVVVVVVAGRVEERGTVIGGDLGDERRGLLLSSSGLLQGRGYFWVHLFFGGVFLELEVIALGIIILSRYS